MTDLSIPYYMHIEERPEHVVYLLRYQITGKHQLQQKGYRQQRAFSQLSVPNMFSDFGSLSWIIFNDESVVYLSKYWNAQNTCIWGAEIPSKIQKQ